MEMAFQYVLPAAVSAPLETLRRRVRHVALIRGVGVFLLIGTALFGAVLAADLLFDLKPSARVIALAVLLVGEAALAGWLIGRPVFRKLPDSELASLAEQRFPELRERVSSLVEFSDPNIAEGEKGSRLMRELLEEQTVQELHGCRFDEAVSTAPAVRRLSIGLGVVCFFLITLMVFSSPSKLLLARLFSPLGNYASVSRILFAIPDGERVVARGSNVTITADVRWRSASEDPIPEPVELHWLTEAGDTDTRDLQFDPETGAFTAMMPSVQDPFEFFITADGSRSERIHINVVDPPEVVAAKLEVAPPGYLGRPVQAIDGATGEITVFERSRLQFELTFNKPVHAAHIDWTAPSVLPDSKFAIDAGKQPDKPNDVERQTGPYTNELVRLEEVESTELQLAEDGLSASLEMPAQVQGVFAFRLTDEFGLSNTDEPHRQFVVTRDQPPLLDVSGESREQARPDDVYVVNVAAVDDIGLEALELHVSSRQGLDRKFTLDPKQLGRQAIEHPFRIDLADLALRVGDVLQLQVRAADSRPKPEPNEIWSEPRLLSISENASAQGANGVLARQNELRKELQAIRNELRESEEDSEQLQANTVSDIGTGQEPDRKAVQTLVGQETEIADRIGSLADAFAEHPLFANLTDETRKLSTDQLQPAIVGLSDAVEQNARQQLDALDENTDVVDAVELALGQLEGKFEELAELEKDLTELSRIAQRSAQLAEDAVALREREQQLEQQADGNLPEGQIPQDLQAEQQELFEDGQVLAEEHNELLQTLQDLMEQRPEILQAARDDQLDKLAALAEQARELAEPQDLLADALQKDADRIAQDVAPIAEQQEQIAERVEQLAARANANQVRQPVEPIDPELARQIVDELRKGNLEEAQELQQQAKEDLQELFRELANNDELPEDPREAARELARMQRELTEEIEAAAAAAQNSEPAADEEAADIRKLAAREAALQMATAQLEPQRATRDQQQQAVNQAAESLQNLIRAAKADQQTEGAQQANAQQSARKADALQQAAKNAQAAAEALDQLAESTQSPETLREEAIAALEQLREQQDELQNEALTQAKPEVADLLNDKDPEAVEALQQLADEQQKLAEQLANLDVPAAAAEQRQAVDAAVQAIEDLANERLADVPLSQRELDQALRNLDDRLEGELTPLEQVEQLRREHQQLAREATGILNAPDAGGLAALADREQDFAGRVGEIAAPAAERPQEAALVALLDASGLLNEDTNPDEANAALKAADVALSDFADALRPGGTPQPDDPGELLEQLAQQQQQAAEQATEQAEAGEAAAAPNQAAAEQLADAVDQLERLRPGDAAQEEKLETLQQLKAAQQKQEDLGEKLAQAEAGDVDLGDQLRDMLAQNAQAQQDAAEALQNLERDLKIEPPQQAAVAANEEADPENGDLAQQLAELLGEPEPEPQQVAEMARDLARQQENLGDEVAQLDEEFNPQNQDAAPPGQAQPADQPAPDGAQPDAPIGAQEAAQELAEQQAELNEQAAELPLDIGALQRAEALQQLAQAEEALENGDLGEALAAQREAEQALQNLAREAEALAETQQPGQPPGEQIAQAEPGQQLGGEPAGAGPGTPTAPEPAAPAGAEPGTPPGGGEPGQPGAEPAGQQPGAEPGQPGEQPTGQPNQESAQLAAEAAELAEFQQQLEQALIGLSQAPGDAGTAPAEQGQPANEPGGDEPSGPAGQEQPAGQPGAEPGSPPAGAEAGSPPVGGEAGPQPAGGEVGAQPGESGQPGSPPGGSPEGEQPGGQQPAGEQPGEQQPGGQPAGQQPGEQPGQQPGLEQLLAQQQELAAETAQMALDAAEQLGADSPAAQAAAEAAQGGQQAAASAQGAQAEQAAQQAGQAAQAAEAAAGALAEEAPGMARQAQELAAQQQQLAEGFEAVANDAEQLAAARQQRQQQFADEAAQLAEAFEELGQVLGQEPLGLQSQGENAAAAQQAAQQGQAAAQQSAQSMQAGAGNQGDAAQAAQQAAEAFQQAAQQAGQAGPAGQSDQPSPVPGELASQVAEAMRQLQAAQQQFGQVAPSQNGESGAPVDSGQPLAQEPGGTSSSGTPSQGSLAGNGTQSSGGTPSGGGSNQPPAGPQSPSDGSQSPPSGSESSGSQPGGEQPGAPTGSQPAGGESTGGEGGSNGQSQSSALAQAAQSLQQAAQALQQAAQEMTGNGQQPNRSTPGNANSTSPGGGEGNSSEGGDLSPLQQQLQAQAMRNWGKLPGKLKTEILQSAQRKANGDYAKLIKLYFEEIAKAGQRTSK
jgi:hypothetical protein